MDDLVERDGLFYKKFTDIPFTGEMTGKGQGKIRNGKKHGSWVWYYDNGRISSKGTYKDGKKDGFWIRYWENGQLSYKGIYKDGEWGRCRDGSWAHYWKNGQLRYEGTYKDGEKDGPWVGYNKDGTMWKSLTGTFKNGVKVK